VSALAEARPAAAAAPPTGTPADSEVRSRRGAALRLATRIYGRELARHKLLTGSALLLPAMGNIALSSLPPLAVAALVDELATGGAFTTATVAPLVLGFFASLLAGQAFWRAGIHCLNRADARGIENLYVDGMDALLAKDASFFHENFSGSLTKRVLSFASQYEDFVDTLAFQIVAQVLPLTFASVVLWRYDPWLVVVLVGMIVVTAVVVVPLIRRRQVLVDAREASWTRLSGHVADTLTNMDAVRAYASELREAAEHRRRVAEHKRLTLRAWDYNNLRIDTVVAPMSVLTNAAGLVLALLVALREGGPGVGAVAVTVAYFTQTTRIRRAEPLFDGLDLMIAPGERVGLVGRSGGGKTTIVRLLLRLMDVQGGRILVGGQDVTKLSQADLRGLIASVPQDPVMFHRTLRENIAFGRPGASDQEIVDAARAAHVLEFVEGLPDGFDTLVGERGVKLSGGQRQRVAIARAVLRDAPILLLDEATSALDSESEALIQEALWRLMEGRTAIAVAHRLSTVAGMDRLVVLDKGGIVEEGTHAELLTRGGGYARLWERQSGGFLSE